MIRRLSEGPDPVASVGGKAASLQALTAAGFRVPDGIVLAVPFFEPWMAEVRRSTAWKAFAAAAEPERGAAAAVVRTEASRMTLPPDRAEALRAALANLEGDRFAVRSSSPEEDLDGSSFAGGYETLLGVPRKDLAAAVARAFASCFDGRVAAYKAHRGFDVLDPSIAVVVQRQLASEVAGVAFTVDPVDGDADHVVITANHGLGESVVAGTASPDQWTVDRVTSEVLASVQGAKETAVFLADEGGTVAGTPPTGPSLTDPQVREVAQTCLRAEAVYGRPLDIEWAYAEGALHLLQARPVTTALDLPDDLRTEPGAPRRLYWDVTISVQGVLRPMSPLGTDALHRTVDGVLAWFGGPGTVDRVEHSPVIARHGRLLLSLSNLFAVATPEGIGPRIGRNVDPIAGAAIASAERSRYASPVGVRALRGGAVRFFATRAAPRLIGALVAPERARRRANEAAARTREALAAMDLATLRTRGLFETGRTLALELLPRFAASRVAMALLGRLVGSADAEALDRALPHNITVEMGLALSKMTALVPDDVDATALAERLAAGTAPPALQAAWADFLGRHGHRGPLEIDAATPRYRERPRMLVEQLVALRAVPPDQRPDPTHQRAREARLRATEALVAKSGPLRGRLVRHLAHVVEELGGLRELPKFLIVTAIDRVRAEVLAVAEGWGPGVLPRPEAVFDLLLDDLTAPPSDPDALRATRRAGADRLARSRELPRVFDSRGRVLRGAAPPVVDGALVGLGVSPGVIRGPVAVLHHPDDRPLRPGEILVARATDPGWTPLFVNAAAIVLEVGGMLQHGAVVAREYGKPCVTGIADATRLLRDGEEIEVDGSSGQVRRIAAHSPKDAATASA